MTISSQLGFSRHAIALVTTSWLFAASAQANQIETLASSGNLAPEGNGSFDFFSDVVMNSQGDVAFLAFLANVPAGFGTEGAYLHSAGNLQKLARDNDLAPDNNGVFENFLSAPTLSDNGSVAFAASFSSTVRGSADDTAILRFNNNSLRIAVREGGNATGDGAEFANFNGRTNITANSTIGFDAGLRGSSAPPQDLTSVWTDQVVGAPQLIARGADTSPDGNGQFVSFGDNAINNEGDLAFSATLTNTNAGSADDAGVYLNDAGNFSALVRTGDSAGDGQYSSFADVTINDNETVAFAATIGNTADGSDDQALLVHSQATTNVILRQGDAAPAGGTIKTIGQAILNQNDAVITKVTLDGTGTSDDQAVLLHDSNGTTQVLRKGSALADGSTIRRIDTIGLNDTGQVAAHVRLSNTPNGSADNQAIVVSDGIDTLVAVRKGDTIGGRVISDLSVIHVDASVQDEDQRAQINAASQVAFAAIFDDNSSGVFRYTPELNIRSNAGVVQWDDEDNWTLGQMPGEDHAINLASDGGDTTLIGSSNNINVDSITVGSGADETVLQLTHNIVVTAPNGITIDDNGMLTGVSTLMTDLTNSGMLDAGNSPGTLTISGNYTQAGGGLNLELGGLTPGTEHDQLIIGGDADLNGNLFVQLVNGFMLDFGQSFTVLDIAGTLTGQFLGFAEGARLGNYNGIDLFITYQGNGGNDVVLFSAASGASVSTVPVHSTLLLLLPGLVLLARRRTPAKSNQVLTRLTISSN